MEYSNHSVKQYAIRTGREISTALTDMREDMKFADRCDDVCEILLNGFSIVKYLKGDFYLTWHDDRVNEDLCAIVRKGVIVTVLTKEMYSWARRRTKVGQDLRYSKEGTSCE